VSAPNLTLPVPDDRTIVDGIWVDTLDDLSVILDKDPGFIAIGRSKLAKSVTKFAASAQIATGQTEDIWDAGGNLQYLDSAETINISSSSTEDNPAGTGAFSIQVLGLDDEFEEIDEIVVLNGTTNVPTINQYKRIYRMFVVTADQAAAEMSGAVGTIVATAAIAGTVQAQITSGANQTLMSHYTIPKGFIGGITTGALSVGKNDDATFLLRTRAPFPGAVFTLSFTAKLFQSVEQIDAKIPLGPIPAGTDIKFQAIAGTNNTIVHASYILVLARIETLDGGVT